MLGEGGAQNNTVESLATMQKSAAALDAAVSVPTHPLKNVSIWDISTRVNAWKQKEDDTRAFRKTIEHFCLTSRHKISLVCRMAFALLVQISTCLVTVLFLSFSISM